MTPDTRTAGINRENRTLLERLHREMPGAFDVDRATKALCVEPARARQLLAYLARRGWLSRIRRGLYVAVPLDSRRPGEWTEDPWIVAERTFAPCYIGGWTACEHWGFTEQTFRTVLVMTAKKVRERDQELQGMRYRLAVRSENKFFGTSPVWRSQVRVQVSDPARTMVDVLDDPTLGGGMRNVADMIHEYLASEHRNDDQLVDYGDQLGNGAVFKRLGFVVEHLGIDAPDLVTACKNRRTAGLITLDPSIRATGRIVRRWGIRANVNLGTPGGDW